MNKAAYEIAGSVLGTSFKNITISRQVYTVYPATIKVICRVVSEWSKLGVDIKDDRLLANICLMPKNAPIILKGLSFFVAGDVKDWKKISKKLYKQWTKGTPSALPEEMLNSVQVTINLMGGHYFFDCATLCLNAVKMVAKPKSESSEIIQF